MTAREYLTADEVANVLGVKPKTVRAWIHNGKLQGKKDVLTGRLLVSRASLKRRVDALKDVEPNVPDDEEGDASSSTDSDGDASTEDADAEATAKPHGAPFVLREEDPPGQRPKAEETNADVDDHGREAEDEEPRDRDFELQLGPFVFLGRTRRRKHDPVFPAGSEVEIHVG